MNNSQFRQLVLDTPKSSSHSRTSNTLPGRDGVVASSLGSRMRSSIPMTPRSVVNSTGIDFARQLAERNASLNPAVTKKFRSAPAPKGTKLGPGYQDRTQSRTSSEDDEKARRIKALEDMVKLGQMEMSTFEALRDEIVGGDVKNVHLVKGLDWKLLERVRRGEDVLGDSLDSTKSDVGSQTLKEGPEAPTEVEIEEELDRFESKEIQPISKSKNTKKGEMAPPPTVVGRKRNRDEILKELKASRLASAKQSSLGPRFTKVGDRKEKTRMEKDEKGRDVLITVDEDGNVKRKVRKAPNQTNSADNRGLLMPEKDAKPLGMDVVPIAHVAPDLSEEDIFEGVGADYNPLGDPEEDDSGDSTMGDSPRGDRNHTPLSDQAQADNDSNLAPEPNLLANPSSEALDPPPLPAHHPPRNYFNDSTRSTTAVDGTTPSGLQTPILLAALKKASTLIPLSGATSEAEAARLERRRKMLESHDRDADDLDMGFGESRFEDGEDGDEGKVKLSVWGQGGGGGGGGSGEDGNRKGKRKRGGKKRKGDANSAVDVLRVIETRKAAGRQ